MHSLACARGRALVIATATGLAGCTSLLGITEREVAEADGSAFAAAPDGTSVPAGDGAATSNRPEGAAGQDASGPEVGSLGDAPAPGREAGAMDRDSSGGAASDGGAVVDATVGPGAGDGATVDATIRDSAAPPGDTGAGSDGPISCGGPCVLASKLNYPFLIASDSARVYWTEYGDPNSSTGAVKACPLAGCPDAGPLVYSSTEANPRGIAVDGVNVYWAASGNIRWCPVAGCGAAGPQSAGLAAVPFGLAIQNGFLYWVDQGTSGFFDCTIHRTLAPSVGTGPDQVLYDGPDAQVIDTPKNIAADSNYAYVTDYFGGLYRLPLDGGPPLQIDPGTRSGSWPVALTPTDIYYGQIGSILRLAKSAAAPDAGGTVAASVDDTDGLFADPSGYVYWSNFGNYTGNTGTIGKIPTDGGRPVLLAEGLVTPEAVTVSGPYVFWLSNGTLDTVNGGALPNSGAVLRGLK